MVTTPALLGDMIERLTAERVAFNVVARLSGRRGLAGRLKRLRPQLVIIGLLDGEGDAAIHALLAHLPGSKVIALRPDGRAITGYRLVLTRVSLADLSPDRLVDFVIESAADAPRGGAPLPC
jgi:hypothetical protein